MAVIATLTMNPAVEVNTAVGQVAPNRKLRCGPATHVPTGGGVNVARAIHRLGGMATAIVVSGGATGEQLERLLADEGVECLPIAVAGESRQVLHVSETSTDGQFRFEAEGAHLQDREWQTVIDTILSLDPAPQYLVASGSLPPGVPADLYGTLSVIAAERGTKLIVDTSGLPLQHAAGAGTFLLKPNFAELRQLAGAEAFSDFFLEGVARSLVSTQKAHAVAVSMGAQGALAVWPGGVRRIVAPTVPVASRFGAGDSMVAGTVLALSRGMALEDAIEFGVASGSAAVMMPGTELCRRDDAERLFDEMRRSSGN
jgi:6-phosphofructokinase 2